MHGYTVPPLPHWTSLLLLAQTFQTHRYVEHVLPNHDATHVLKEDRLVARLNESR